MIAQALLMPVALFLLVTLAAALVRVQRGPSPIDCMLCAQLFGTNGVAILLLLAEAQDLPALRDTALVVALLSVLAAIAFVHHTNRTTERPHD